MCYLRSLKERIHELNVNHSSPEEQIVMNEGLNSSPQTQHCTSFLVFKLISLMINVAYANLFIVLQLLLPC
jgi:hypothetical protein